MPTTPREIGAELRVAYILAGSIRREGQAVRFTGQLIDARTGAQVWTKRYDRELTNVFAIQAALATDIAGELRATLSPEEQQLIARRLTDNAEAYDAYLKVRADRYSDSTVSRKRFSDYEALMERAVKLDPAFAEGWAELATARSDIFHFGYDQSTAWLAKTTQAIETAHRLAPDSPEVIRARSNYFYRCFRDYPRAIEPLMRLAMIQSNDPEVYQLMGVVQRRQGRWADAIVSTQKAVEIDPRYATGWLNVRHSFAFGRRHDEMRIAIQQMVDLDPTRRFFAASESFRATGSTRELDAVVAELNAEDLNSVNRGGSRLAAAIARGDYAAAVRLYVRRPAE